MGELNLQTTVQRDTITIDDKEYEIRTDGEMAYKEVAFFQHAAKRIQALIEKLNDDYTDREADELEELLDRATKMIVLDQDDSIVDKLRDEQKIRIVEFFSKAAGSGLSNRNEQSPDSSDTMEEPQETGSTLPTG